MTINAKRCPWLVVALFAASLSQAQVPRTINYQGFVASIAGVPVNAPANTPQAMQFSLYTVPTGGAPLWLSLIHI